MAVPFNKPFMSGKELWYISQAHANQHLGGDGPYSKACQAWLEQHTGTRKALLTHSCTAALEMAAILADTRPGDEVIMPSFTFVSTANAFALRGGIPVFVDVRTDTLNLDEALIEHAITPRTKAIVPVHYAGVSCEMDAIMEIARQHELLVIEDAAQGIMSSYRGRPLGSMGHLGTISFHESKNITAGEGGALLVNYASFFERADVIRQKGTNRSRFLQGHVDKYTWVDIGSSFLPGELIAAFLQAQFEDAEAITQKRLALWRSYHELLEPFEAAGHLRRPIIPASCQHNAHIYYVLLAPEVDRRAVLHELAAKQIAAVFHYVPLHSSPAGLRYGRTHDILSVTESVAERLVRLPLWIGMTTGDQDEVVAALREAILRARRSVASRPRPSAGKQELPQVGGEAETHPVHDQLA